MWVKKSAGGTHSLKELLADSNQWRQRVDTSHVWHQERFGFTPAIVSCDAFQNPFGTGHKNNCHRSTVRSPATHTEHSVSWEGGQKNCQKSTSGKKRKGSGASREGKAGWKVTVVEMGCKLFWTGLLRIREGRLLLWGFTSSAKDGWVKQGSVRENGIWVLKTGLMGEGEKWWVSRREGREIKEDWELTSKKFKEIKRKKERERRKGASKSYQMNQLY